MGLLSLLFPPPPSLLELIRRHDLPPLIKLVNREGHHCEGGAAGFLNKPADGDGNTPLILAATHGAYRIVDWIAAQPGVELDARNRFGWTALYEAAGTGNRHVLERLVQAGANPRIPATAWPRQTPRQMAAQMGFHCCVGVLQDAERVWHEKKKEARRLLHEQHKQERAAAAAAAAAAEEAKEEGKSHGQGNGHGAKEEESVTPPPHEASEEGGKGSLKESRENSLDLELVVVEEGMEGMEGGTGADPIKDSSAAAAPSASKALPACLRWQVEEGVGEGGHHSARWTALMLNLHEEEDPFLEVHPVVFHKRGPRVGRHRWDSRHATVLAKIFCCAGSKKALHRTPFTPHPAARPKAGRAALGGSRRRVPLRGLKLR